MGKTIYVQKGQDPIEVLEETLRVEREAHAQAITTLQAENKRLWKEAKTLRLEKSLNRAGETGRLDLQLDLAKKWVAELDELRSQLEATDAQLHTLQEDAEYLRRARVRMQESMLSAEAQLRTVVEALRNYRNALMTRCNESDVIDTRKALNAAVVELDALLTTLDPL